MAYPELPVEPERSDALTRALAAGEIVRVQPASVADGLGAPFTGALPLVMAQHYLDGYGMLQ